MKGNTDLGLFGSLCDIFFGYSLHFLLLLFKIILSLEEMKVKEREKRVKCLHYQMC